MQAFLNKLWSFINVSKHIIKKRVRVLKINWPERVGTIGRRRREGVGGKRVCVVVES